MLLMSFIGPHETHYLTISHSCEDKTPIPIPDHSAGEAVNAPYDRRWDIGALLGDR